MVFKLITKQKKNIKRVSLIRGTTVYNMSIKQLKSKRHSIINRKSTNHTKKILNGGSNRKQPKTSSGIKPREHYSRKGFTKRTVSPKLSPPSPPQQLILGNQRSLPQTLLPSTQPSTQPRKKVFNVLKANQKIIDIGKQIYFYLFLPDNISPGPLLVVLLNKNGYHF